MSHNQIRNYRYYIIVFMLIAAVVLTVGCASKSPAQGNDSPSTGNAAASQSDTVSHTDQDSEKIPVKVLILPKFEEGEITGDAPGEGQYYYDEYCKGGEEYDIRAASDYGMMGDVFVITSAVDYDLGHHLDWREL